MVGVEVSGVEGTGMVEVGLATRGVESDPIDGMDGRGDEAAAAAVAPLNKLSRNGLPDNAVAAAPPVVKNSDPREGEWFATTL